MFCPACGTQNPDNAVSCSTCAQPFSAAAGLNVAPPPPPGAAPASAQVYPPLSPVNVPATPPQPKTMSVLGTIGIVLAALLSVAYALFAPVPELPNEEQAMGFRFGRAIAALLIPFVIAYPIAGRRKERNPNLFAGLFCGLTVLLLLVNVRGQPENRDLG